LGEGRPKISERQEIFLGQRLIGQQRRIVDHSEQRQVRHRLRRINAGACHGGDDAGEQDEVEPDRLTASGAADRTIGPILERAS
jgi:hypothetical protein